MIIRHFGGIESVTSVDELNKILSKRYGNDSNEFWITDDKQDNPCLAILVHKNLANITYFPDDITSLGFQSVGKINDLNSNEYSVFYTNTAEEEIEICNDVIITFDEALMAAIEFFYDNKMPCCIEWTEN